MGLRPRTAVGRAFATARPRRRTIRYRRWSYIVVTIRLIVLYRYRRSWPGSSVPYIVPYIMWRDHMGTQGTLAEPVTGATLDARGRREGLRKTTQITIRQWQDAARLGRVRDPRAEAAQDRRPYRGEGRPHPHPLRFGLSGRRPVPAAGRGPRGLGPLTGGAPCPADPSSFNPKPRHCQPQIPAPQGAERRQARA